MNCRNCKIDKIPEEFPFKNKELGKRASICKICQRAYKRKHYYENKQQHYDRNAKQNDKLKKYLVEVKSAGCVLCPEKEIACLDLHHLDPTTKVDVVAKIVKGGSLKKLKEELDKCIVLCANCHRKVHAGLIKLDTCQHNDMQQLSKSS